MKPDYSIAQSENIVIREFKVLVLKEIENKTCNQK